MKVAVPPSLVRLLGGPMVSTLATSWRVSVRNEEHWRALRDAGERFVFMAWHEALLPLLWQHRGQEVAIVVSEAREGRYLGDYASGLGYHLLSGSSSRGGTRALLGAVRSLRAGRPVAITPDGPRGPRREVKPGVVRAAQRERAWILPLHAAAERAWRIRSWDRLMIPKPGSRVQVAYGAPFRVAFGTEGLATGVRHCAEALAGLAGVMPWGGDDASRE
jgi:lysophospholipid acyltransferase (LPLAT)-like uncharacterized protein